MIKLTRRALLSASALLMVSQPAQSASSKPASKARGTAINGVVELFTSQGCNSCPPADAVFAKLAQRDDILALSYHVDYWDYLGWKDTLGSPENTQRQYAYSKVFGPRSTYTPQAVVNGLTHMNGQSGGRINAQLKADTTQNNSLSVAINLYTEDERFRIHIDEQTIAANHSAKLLVVYYTDKTTVNIKRGENSGKQIAYHNTVNGLQFLGMWDGQAVDIEIPMNEISTHKASNCAVILQATTSKGGPGAILGAATLTHSHA